jgi:hypothetical protein
MKNVRTVKWNGLVGGVVVLGLAAALGGCERQPANSKTTTTTKTTTDSDGVKKTTEKTEKTTETPPAPK